MTLSRIASVFAFLLMLGAAGAAKASCNSLVLCTCSVATTGVSFGNYSVLDTSPNDATGSVTVSCVLTVALAGSFTVSLSPGGSNDALNRTMTSGGNSLAYNLYTSAARTQVWGDGSGGSSTVSGVIQALLLSTQTLQIYGRAPVNQNVPSGSYGDTIVVTVTY